VLFRSSFTDFQDGALGDWVIEYFPGVGDFAGLWSGLKDIDPCSTNYSRQVAFIDNGLVVPGTGGSQCISWCYGPSGYVVNGGGGLLGLSATIRNEVNSPIMPIIGPDNAGMVLEFDVYRHQLVGDGAEVFYCWSIRSADTDGSHGPAQTIADQDWQDRGVVYEGGPEYIRHRFVATDLMNPGSDEVQVQLAVCQVRFTSFDNVDASPAPYFDNVSVKIFSEYGPVLTMRSTDIAQDNFPEVDTINYADLGSMHVRFDMAGEADPNSSSPIVVPGDSIVVSMTASRAGATLTTPEMHYSIEANPVFDSFRTISTTGSVTGIPAVHNGITAPNMWQFDLPDSSALFPGDVLHYYFRASEDAFGDVQYATLPADLTGYGAPSVDPMAYDTRFVVHALPTIREVAEGVYTTPKMLFWNDQGSGDGEGIWYSALQNLAYIPGEDFDIYKTTRPASKLGNGLGGRTAGPALAHYEDILYTSGTMTRATISSGNSVDRGDDLSAILAWLSGGNKDMYLTGDNLVSDLDQSSVAGGMFLSDAMGVDLVDSDMRMMIENQATPLVLAMPGNPVVTNINSWIAYGGCATINRFDAVTARAGAVRLAEFADPSGNAGQYALSALTANTYDGTNRIISQPYSLEFATIDPQATQNGPHAGRVQLLADVLAYFDLAGSAGAPSAVLPAVQFATSHYPNPFNPSTKILYTIRAPGHLTLKVYDARGQLVKTLIDEQVATSGSISWRGFNNAGGRVSSGVYFYEARMGAEVQISKMTMIK